MVFWWAFAVAIFTYSLSRLWFIIWNFKSFGSAVGADLLSTFFYGLRFDGYTVALLALIPGLLWLLARLKWTSAQCAKPFLWLFFVFQLPALALTLGDTEFLNFTGRRFTMDAFFNMRELTTGNTLGIFSQYWLPCLMGVVITAIFLSLLMLFSRFHWLSSPVRFSRGRFALSVLISMILIVMAARGGWQPKPLGFAHAQIFSHPMLNQAVMNSGFTLLQSLGRDPIPREIFMPEEQMLARLNGLLPGRDQLEGLRFKEPQNVVLIVLESFSFEHLGKARGDAHDQNGWTPFLDELSEKSLFFPITYANARRSIDGMTAILAGIPPLMDEPFISSPFFSSVKMHALGQVLKENSYHTSFFHGGNNGTMFFDQFTKAAGLDYYYGAKQYPHSQDHDGSWGIWDEPFLQWAAQHYTEFPKPFASVIFTLSSHHPFKVPKEYTDRFPKGPSEIHEVIGYSDWALRKFFETAEKSPWYQNTLFVVTADHTFKIFRKEYDNELGRYRVPLMFFHPRWDLAKLRQRISTSTVAQHIDLQPSIIDFLGVVPGARNLLGRSLFRGGERRQILGIEGRSYFMSGNHFSQRTAGGDERVFSTQDPEMKTPLSLDRPESQETLLGHRAHLQYFSEGLWQNKLFRDINP